MPRDIKSTNELVLRDFLDKMIGDEKLPAGQDQMQESMSPLDFVPYEKLGSMGADAISAAAKSNALKKLMGDDVVHNILGNEIGAVGKNIKALPMDEASRMARAKEMGFDPSKTYYHGTTSDIKKFLPSSGSGSGAVPEGSEGYSFFSDKPSVANEFADHNIKNNNETREMQMQDPEFWEPFRDKLKQKLQKQSPGKEITDSHIDDALERIERDSPWITEEWAEKQLQPISKQDSQGVVYPVHLKGENSHVVSANKGEAVFDTIDRGFREAADKNADSVLFKNIADSPGFEEKSNIVAVKNPNQVRSKFATFDPKKKDSGDISSAIAGLGLGGAASQLNNSDDQDDKFALLKKKLSGL